MAQVRNFSYVCKYIDQSENSSIPRRRIQDRAKVKIYRPRYFSELTHGSAEDLNEIRGFSAFDKGEGAQVCSLRGVSLWHKLKWEKLTKRTIERKTGYREIKKEEGGGRGWRFRKR